MRFGALGTSIEVAPVMAKTSRWQVERLAGIAVRGVLVLLLVWMGLNYAVRSHAPSTAQIGIALLMIAFVLWRGDSQERAFVHPGPALASVPVSAAMLRRVQTVRHDQRLEDAAQILLAAGQNQLPVLDHGHAVGVITRSDIAKGLQSAGPQASVGSAPQHEVVTVDPTEPLDAVLERLKHSPDAVALVVDHGTPVGLVTAETLADYVALRRTAA
jgi:CBS domain-containing protein